MRNYNKILITLIIVFIFIPFSITSAQIVQKTKLDRGSGTVNWVIGVIRVTGIGAPPPHAVNAGQKRAMALKAARSVAYRNLLELTKGVKVSSTTTVNNFMSNDIVKTKVMGIIKGARFVGQKYLSDGSVEVTLELPIYGKVGLSSAIYAYHKKNFGTKISQKPSSTTKNSVAYKKLQEELERTSQKRIEAEKAMQRAKEKAKLEEKARIQAEKEKIRLEAMFKKKKDEDAVKKSRENAEKKVFEAELKRLEEKKKALEKETLEAERKKKEAEENARKAKEVEKRKQAEKAARIAKEELRKKELEKKKAEEMARRAKIAKEQRLAVEKANKIQAEKEKKKHEEELQRIEQEKRKAEAKRKQAIENARRKAEEAAVRKKTEEEMRKKLQETSPSETTEIAAGVLSKYTGIIVDSSGTGAKPAMSPKLLIVPPPPPEKEVYSMAEADYQVALNVGLVGYASSISNAKKRKRIGSKPLIVNAIGIKKGKPSDVKIKYKDGKKILVIDEKNKVLEKCKVVMVLGR